jgi:hypothetical protein
MLKFSKSKIVMPKEKLQIILIIQHHCAKTWKDIIVHMLRFMVISILCYTMDQDHVENSSSTS